MTTWKEANQKRLCLCCGKPNARLFTLSDGRAWRTCQTCLDNCDACIQQLNGAVEREPMQCEKRTLFPEVP